MRVRDPEVLVAGPELLDGGLLVRVVHEVDVALEDLGVELQGVLHQQPVLRVLLVAEHVHEGAVVDAVHAEGADEVALHQPEGLGQQQRVGRLGGDPVHHLAPELLGHGGVERLPGHGRARRARGWRRPGPGSGNQRRWHVLLGQGHGGVEADDREAPGDVQDRLDDRLADLGLAGSRAGRCRSTACSCRRCRGRCSGRRRSSGRRAGRRPRRRSSPSSGPRSGCRPAGRRRGPAPLKE